MRYVEDPDDPDHVIDLDAVDELALRRAENWLAALPADDERRDRLAREEAAAPEIAARPVRARGGTWIVLTLCALVWPLAVLVRLVTSPWREEMHHRARCRVQRARARRIEKALALHAQADSAETFLKSGFAWLEVGQALRAEAAFDACLQKSVSAGPGKRASAIQNRGAARARLGHTRLARADHEEALRLGGAFRTPFYVTLIEVGRMVRIFFVEIAGIGED